MERMDNSPQFTGACLAGENAGFFPATACGNKGPWPYLAIADQLAHTVYIVGTAP